MTQQPDTNQDGRQWYTRPVFFVADVNRAARFYIDMLGFRKDWHEGDGAGTVCQVERDGCEIILWQTDSRRDKGRLFISLNADEIETLRRALVEREIPSTKTWWGYDCIQIVDTDGNELLFPIEDKSIAVVD